MAHRAVVLGGGAAGLSAANRLAVLSAAGGLGVEVVLVDRSPDHVFAPGFVSVMVDGADPDRFRRPLLALARPEIRVVAGSVGRIDPHGHAVIGSFGELEYDSLVVALGVEVGWPGPPPVEDAAPWTAAGAAAGARLLSRLGPSERVVVATAGPGYRCPPAVFDLAVRIRRRTGARVTVAHPWPRPLAPFGEDPARRFEDMLAAAGVGFVGNFVLDGVDGMTLRSAAGGTVAFDAAVVVPPHRPPDVVAGSALAGEAGWMAVGYPGLTHPDFPDVYGVGDLVSPALRVGMAGTLGVFEGAFVAARIAEAAGGPAAPAAPRMSAICFVDQQTTGSFLHCDFSGPAGGTGPARCELMPDLPYFRRAKRLFAEEWFASTLGGEVG